MSHNFRISIVENSKLISIFFIIWICFFKKWFFLLIEKKDKRDSDVRPIQLGGVKAKKRGLYMDGAISKTSKSIFWEKILKANLTNGNIRFEFNLQFFLSEFGLFNYIVIFLSGIILITVTNEISNICYILPVADCDLNLNPIRKGILAGAPYIGIVNMMLNTEFLYFLLRIQFPYSRFCHHICGDFWLTQEDAVVSSSLLFLLHFWYLLRLHSSKIFISLLYCDFSMDFCKWNSTIIIIRTA